MASEHRGDHVAGTREADDLQFRRIDSAGGLRDQRQRDVVLAADAGDADGDRRGIVLQLGDEILAGLDGRVAIDREGDLLVLEQGERRYVGVAQVHVAGDLVAQQQRRHDRDHVAAPAALIHVRPAERAEAAGLVHHRNRLLDQMRALPDLLQQARGAIESAARVGAHHDLDRPIGLPGLLREGRAWQGDCCHRQDRQHRGDQIVGGA